MFHPLDPTLGHDVIGDEPVSRIAELARDVRARHNPSPDELRSVLLSECTAYPDLADLMESAWVDVEHDYCAAVGRLPNEGEREAVVGVVVGS